MESPAAGDRPNGIEVDELAGNVSRANVSGGQRAGIPPRMDEPTRMDCGDDREARQLWSGAVWGLGMIGTVLVMVALIAAVAAP